MTSKCAGSATCRWQAGGSIWNTSVGASTVLGAAVVHVEHLDWLANNSRYTLAFCDACGQAVPDKAVAEMERLRLLVEGVNNKIRVLQRRAYGYRDEEYLKLKIVAAFLPPLPRNAVFNPHESA